MIFKNASHPSFRIHGTENSRVYEAAVSNNISVLPQDPTYTVLKSDGTEGNKEFYDEIWNFVSDIVDEPPEKPEKLGKFVTDK